MHTEEEAALKWCPFARTVYVGDSGNQQQPCNRFASTMGVQANPEDARCIGSACMAWQWSDVGHHNPLTNVWERLPKGYCGLAVRP